jgi:hypothetical protein
MSFFFAPVFEIGDMTPTYSAANLLYFAIVATLMEEILAADQPRWLTFPSKTKLKVAEERR